MNSNFTPGILNKGDTIEFLPRYGDKLVRATVVTITRWAHCIGASDIAVYAAGQLYSLPLIGGNFLVTKRVATAEEGAAEVAKALESYKAHLNQYAAWQERFNSGFQLAF